MEGLKLPKGALEKEKIRAVLSRLDMLEKRANEAESELEKLIELEKLNKPERLDELDNPEKLEKLEKRIGALEKALEKKK